MRGGRIVLSTSIGITWCFARPFECIFDQLRRQPERELLASIKAGRRRASQRCNVIGRHQLQQACGVTVNSN